MNKLKQARESKNISISELARLSNVTRATIYRLENGKVDTANTKTLVALADALGVEVQVFFES